MTPTRKTPAEFETRERCHITELVNSPDWPTVSLARARVEPGVTTELHAVSVDEWYVIESGCGLMVVGEAEPWPVGPGDCVAIPADCEQQITNTGDADLLFFCVCAPRFRPERYRALESKSE